MTKIVSKKSCATKTGRTRPQALLAIASLFLLSGIVRFGDGVGQAIAAEEKSADSAATTALPDQAPGADQLLALLQEREAALNKREEAIDDRMQALKLGEEAIKTRLAALEQAETELAATLALADKAAEEDLTRLTAVYEAMKPKDTALIFEAMEPEFSAGFLTRMRPETAGAILAGLSAEKAYAVSVVVAGRNSAAPKN